MRYFIAGSMVAFALLAQGHACAAQEAPSSQPTAESPARVNSLSPDEARRAARARARKATASVAKGGGGPAVTDTRKAPQAAAAKSDIAAQEVKPKRPLPPVAPALAQDKRAGHNTSRQATLQNARRRTHRVGTGREPVVAIRDPRIGDTIPPDAPLYPLPRRFGPVPVVVEGARYQPYPPYPRYLPMRPPYPSDY